jgi:hypothetical protein
MQTANELIAFVKRDYARKQEEAEAHRLAQEGRRFADAMHPRGYPKEQDNAKKS